MNNIENLEGLVAKLKEQGINDGNIEKNRIIESAKKEADELLTLAQNQSEEIVTKAKMEAEQYRTNTEESLKQAVRDIIESTKIEVLNHLKSTFREQTNTLFTKAQYSEELLKTVIKLLPGDKTIAIDKSIQNEMEAFLLKQATKEKISLKPLGEENMQIIIETGADGNMQYVLSSKDIEKGLFSLLNNELVERITNTQEVEA